MHKNKPYNIATTGVTDEMKNEISLCLECKARECNERSKNCYLRARRKNENC